MSKEHSVPSSCSCIELGWDKENALIFEVMCYLVHRRYSVILVGSESEPFLDTVWEDGISEKGRKNKYNYLTQTMLEVLVIL